MSTINNIISIYGAHDAAATYIDNNNKIKIIEYERLVKQRYAMYSDQFDNRSDNIGTNETCRRKFLSFIKNDIANKDVATITYNNISQSDCNLIKEYFPKANFIETGHHTAHAECGYYTSPFKDAFIISIDGGGREFNLDITTKTFVAKDGLIEDGHVIDIDLGKPYRSVGNTISEVKPWQEISGDRSTGGLAIPGKIMGLCAYGEPRTEWIQPMRDHYDHKQNNLPIEHECQLLNNCLEGKDSYDLAATSQYVFEEKFFEIFWPMILEHNLDVILVGGCALNVLLNQKLSERLETIGKKMFVPSNPNDCGLSLGQFLGYHKIRPKSSIVYNGIDILDEDKFDNYVADRNPAKCTTGELVDLITKGKIVGIINDGSEIGPRALGNRSIICDPSIPDMKDILNSKVKFREWFRPFAPVCRFEDKDEYFDKAYECKFMSYAPMVRDEYREILPSITHIDGTSRLQTVKESDHQLFYDILTEMKNKSLTPVILNTSFNIKGAPILTTIEDALFVLDNTELDHVYCKGYLF